MATSLRELHGLDTPFDELIELKAGTTLAQFEPARGYLRRVRIAGEEAVRVVYLHVRDKNWGTVMPKVTMTRREVGEDRFVLEWDATSDNGDAAFMWHGKAEGFPDGRIVYACDGAAIRDYQSMRTGLCALSPEEYSGQPCTVVHPDGSKTAAKFWERVSTQHPFAGIKELRYGMVRLEFDGDVFETEDQRNWTDSSYKTFPVCGDGPKPYTLKAGETVHHALTIVPVVEEHVASAPEPISLGEAQLGSLPRVGTTLAGDHADFGAYPAHELNFVRLDLSAGANGKIPAAVAHAGSFNKTLHVVIRGSDKPVEGATIQFSSDPNGGPVDRLAGTESHGIASDTFTSLNFHGAFGWDGPERIHRHLEFGAMPQIHTFDERSILENSRTVTENIRTALEHCDAGIAHLTLRMNDGGDDERADSLFGALWLLSSYASAARGRAGSVCVGHTPGPEGVWHAGRVTPIGHLLRTLALGGKLVETKGGVKAEWAILARERGERRELFVGNLLRHPATFDLAATPGRCQVLTPTGWKEETYAPTFEPYQLKLIEL